MRILILDDSRSRLATFRRKLIGAVVTCVEHASDCIKELEKNGPWDVFYCDHDLDNRVFVPSGIGTGYEVILWITNNLDKKPTKVILHTLNNIGALNMLKIMPDAIYRPGVFYSDISIQNLY